MMGQQKCLFTLILFFSFENSLPKHGFDLGLRFWVAAGFIAGASITFPFYRTAVNRDHATTYRD